MKMKRQFTKMVSVLFVLTITAVFLLPPAYSHSFWYGDKITDNLDPNTAQALHDYLKDEIVPRLWTLDGTLMGITGVLSCPNNNPDNHEGVTVYKPEKCWNGYTLLNSLAGHLDPDSGGIARGILIDMEGNIVNEWFGPNRGSWIGRMLPGGYFLGPGPVPGFNVGSTTLAQYDWDGNIVREWDFPWHHDCQLEGNPCGYYAPGLPARTDGGIALLIGTVHVDPNLTGHISKFQLSDEALYEVDEDGRVLWEWHSWEHIEQMGLSDAAREGIMNVNVLFSSLHGPGTDWQHMSSVSRLGPNKWFDEGDLRFDPDNIICNGWNTNMAYIIARHDHPDGEWVAGDIVWRAGPDYSYGNPEYKLGQVVHLYEARMIPRGLPGAGNIMGFDSGGHGGFGPLLPGLPGHFPNTFRDYSRIIEFDPTTLDMVWEWKHPKTADTNGDGIITAEERKFSAWHLSNAQRLENGNTLISEACWGRVFEVTQDGEIVWEFISPFRDDPFPPFLQKAVSDNGLFSALRVPYTWAPIPAPN
jgi:hypothetical protein